MVAVTSLEGSGGAERLFSVLHEYLTAQDEGPHVTLVTAQASLSRLQAAGHLSPPAGVLALALGPTPGKGKLGVAWMTLALLWATLVRRFDLVHVCLPSPIYVPFLAVLSRLPRALRPRLTLTVIDCTLAGSFENPPPAETYERQVLDAHRLYFRWTALDGVYSWYRAFVEVAPRAIGPGGATIVQAARYCFTEPARFRPATTKERLIVFAGRLSHQKRPLLFVDAVARLREREPDLVSGYRFELYGRGVLDEAVRDRIAFHRLGGVLTQKHGADMAPVFARSQVFVSTQAIENFTSLSMLEAMAAGNAIIAQDLGQTREFVRPGENGLLVEDESPDAFADAITQYLQNPQLHAGMAAASRAIATDVHTIKHFAGDIDAFWSSVLPPHPSHSGKDR
jgi:glycosyltransferase involved in cell wall biosynthesis